MGQKEIYPMNDIMDIHGLCKTFGEIKAVRHCVVLRRYGDGGQ